MLVITNTALVQTKAPAADAGESIRLSKPYRENAVLGLLSAVLGLLTALQILFWPSFGSSLTGVCWE